MTIDQFKERYRIAKLYSYHEVPKENGVIEIGWIPVEEISLRVPIVIATQDNNQSFNNAVTLSDYKTYFSNLTSMTPEKFIMRWKNSPKDLNLFWKSNMPKAEVGTDVFMMKLAFLIQERISFSHSFLKGETFYQIVEVEHEANNSNGNQIS